MKENLLVITGPTGIGKTDLSIKIAKKYKGQIISADSMQIYKKMDIGTGKIKKDEMEGIDHYLIDFVNPDEDFSVDDFKKIAKEKISYINNKNKLPIIVGGTGLYINSIVYDFSMQKTEKNEDFRKNLEYRIKNEGLEKIYKELYCKDKGAALKIHPNNKQRIIRALEIFEFQGKKETENFRKKNDSYNLFMIGLNTDREILYDRINKRVDKMFEMGFIDEVRELLKEGFDENLTSMKAIGYREVIDFLKGNISLDEAKEKMKQFSRNYAKRQLTWFRRDERIFWFDPFKDKEERLFEKIDEKFL